MVNLKELRRSTATAVETVLAAVVTAAAAVYRHRATIIDAVGAACVAVFASMYITGAGYLVAGLWLLVQAFNIERRPK